MPFTNHHLSFSRLQRYEQCPRSFKLHYIDGAPSEPGPEADFGRAMHRALERLVGEHALATEPAALSVERAERLWQQAWADSRLVGVGAFYDGIRMLGTFVRSEGVVDPATVLAVEKEFELGVGRFRVIGAIDRVDRTGPSSIRIRDYKTGRLLPTRAEVDESLQLSLYCLAARELWPWAETVELQLDMVRHDLRLRTSRTDTELEAARRYVETLGERTEGDPEYAPRPSPNCVHCDHKSQCDAYARALAGERTVHTLDLRDIEAVAREREEVACIARVTAARKAQLEAVLKARLEDYDKLDVAGMRYRLATSCSLAYPLEPTLRALEEATWLSREELVARLATIDRDALFKLLDDVGKRLPKPRVTMLRAHLEATAERTLTPRFSAKPVRGT
jgi:putative RecB family exonuclease